MLSTRLVSRDRLYAVQTMTMPTHPSTKNGMVTKNTAGDPFMRHSDDGGEEATEDVVADQRNPAQHDADEVDAVDLRDRQPVTGTADLPMRTCRW